MKAVSTFARGKCFNSNFQLWKQSPSLQISKNQFSSSNRELREVHHDAEPNYARMALFPSRRRSLKYVFITMYNEIVQAVQICKSFA